MNVYVTELEKWVESGLSTFEIRRLVAEIYFSHGLLWVPFSVKLFYSIESMLA